MSRHLATALSLTLACSVGCALDATQSPASSTKNAQQKTLALRQASNDAVLALAKLAGKLEESAMALAATEHGDGADDAPSVEETIQIVAAARSGALQTIANRIDKPLERLLSRRVRLVKGRAPQNLNCEDLSDSSNSLTRAPLLRLLALQNPHTFPLSRGIAPDPPKITTLLRLAHHDPTSSNTVRDIYLDARWLRDPARVELTWHQTPMLFVIVTRDTGQAVEESCITILQNTPYTIPAQEARSAWLIRQRTPREPLPQED